MTVVTLSMKACSFVAKRVAFGHFNGSPLFRNIVIMRAISMPSNKKHFMTGQYWQGATVEVPSADIQPDKSVLQKGRALKSTKQRKRLPEKQKKYLLDFYWIGESTGHKVQPASVARSMRKSKNSDGGLLSDAGEFLMPQEIEYFFSRLSKKRVFPTNSFISLSCKISVIHFS